MHGRDMPWCTARVHTIKGERRCHRKQFAVVFMYVYGAWAVIPTGRYCKDHYDKLVQYGDANLNIGKITGLLI